MAMKNYCLATKEVSVSHNAENLATELKQSIDEWELSDKKCMDFVLIMLKI